jgi:hypothetical protein
LGGDLARGEGACAVRVDQQLQRHPGRVGQFALATDAVGLDQPVNVQRGNRVLDEPREVPVATGRVATAAAGSPGQDSRICGTGPCNLSTQWRGVMDFLTAKSSGIQGHPVYQTPSVTPPNPLRQALAKG